jgi:hypothetical protein
VQSNNKLSETLIALIGIWLVVSPIPDFMANIFAYSTTDFGESGNQMRFIPIIHLSTKLLCGLGLIFTRSKIVSILGLDISIPSDTRNLLSASVFLLGVYFILNGCVAFGQFYATAQSDSLSNPYLFWQGIFSTASGVIVGIMSSRLGKFWWLLKRS